MCKKENQETYIRADWFSDHVATKHELTDAAGNSVIIIDWGKPGTGAYSVRYLLNRNYVFVCGDLGEAVFCLTENATLEKLSAYDLQYFFGKMSCISDRDNGIEFDADTAKEFIRGIYEDYYDEAGAPTKEFLIELENAAEESGSVEYWRHRLDEIDDQFSLDEYGDWWESLPSCGNVYGNEVVAYLLGLKMAYEQLKGEGENKKG